MLKSTNNELKFRHTVPFRFRHTKSQPQMSQGRRVGERRPEDQKSDDGMSAGQPSGLLLTPSTGHLRGNERRDGAPECDNKRA